MRKYRISIIAIIIAVAITSYFIYVSIVWKSSTGPFPMDWSVGLPNDDTAFAGLFQTPRINDSLPHIIYKRQEDSIKRIIEERQLNNRSLSFGMGYGTFGFYYAKKTWGIEGKNIYEDPVIKSMLDTLNNLSRYFPGNSYDDSVKRSKSSDEIMWRLNLNTNKKAKENNKNEERHYYFGLNKYDLDYNNKFFMQGETFNLAYVKWDSVIKRTYDSTKTGHYERKQIEVRYSTDDKRILIPISKKKYDFFKSALSIFIFISIFFLIYIFIGLPIQILIDISKGKAFTKANIRRFKLVAYVLFFCTFLKVFSPYILNFFYRKMIPKEFHLEPVSSAIISNIYLFLIALVLFFVGKAFQKGYNLQEEEELTV